MNPKYVSAFLCAFLGGVGVASFYEIGLTHAYIFAVVSLTIAGVVSLWKRFVGTWLFCLVLGVLCGWGYGNLSFQNNEYQNYIGQSFDSEGIIVGDPQVAGATRRGQTLVLLPRGFTQYLRTQLYTAIPDARQGDRVWIRGQVELPDNFSGFDYVGYLQRWQIYAELKKPKVIILHRLRFVWREPGTWIDWIRTPLVKLRLFLQKQSQVFPEREGSIIIGMLIGQKQNIPDEVLKNFQRTGLTHIVAVSGFNMTVIATACGALVYHFGRRVTNLFIIAIVIMFVVVTGATAAVVRAAVMAVIMVVGQLLGRRYASLYSLLLVSVIMILQNPRVLVWDVGFQLSAVATLGVLLTFQIKNPASTEVSISSTRAFLEDTLRPTIGAILFTWPIICYNFGTFSLIAPIANLMVLPFVTWIMLLGVLSLVPIVGHTFVYPAQLLTSTILYITEKLSDIPYANVNLILPVWVFGVYYVLLISSVIFMLQKHRKSAKL